MLFVERIGAKGETVRRLSRTPRYIGPHRARGLRGDGATEWDEPEAVHSDRAMHRPVRGKVQHVRQVPADMEADFAEIDRQRQELRRQLAELEKEERQLIEVAYTHGRPLTVTEVKAMIPAVAAQD